jgi:DNA recombination protein RmuC
MTNLFFLAIGLFVGGSVIWLLTRGKLALTEANARVAGEVERALLAEQLDAARKNVEQERSRVSAVESEARILRAEVDRLGSDCATLSERARRLAAVEQQLKTAGEVADALKGELADLRESSSGTIARLTKEIEQERTQSREKLALLTDAREQLSNQFKALANEILDEKSKKFTEQNKTNLSGILDPLKERITAFQAKVEEVYINESKDRSALGEQVKMLTQLNATLGQDAQNLTLALKGDRKAQGNWGEIILEDLLERAGLKPGLHYDVQSSVKAEDGLSYVIPDVVVKLPGDRHLVIDSKLTLPDYRAFAAADDESERADALKRHVAATRAHMKGLSEKQYQSLYGIRSLDFVIMFFPLEPAFMLAVTNDRELYHDAWEKNVLPVSPSTLLFVVRTVANLWRQEDQSRNAQEISRRGKELYDKLVGFVEDLKKVGEQINLAQDTFNSARKKLSEGKGNVIRQAEMLKDLGVKPTKSLPAQWIGSALDDPAVTTRNELSAPVTTPEASETGNS